MKVQFKLITAIGILATAIGAVAISGVATNAAVGAAPSNGNEMQLKFLIALQPNGQMTQMN